MFGKQFKPKVIANIKSKSRSLFIECFQVNPKGKRMSMLFVDLKIRSKQNMFLNKNSMIRIGYGVILRWQCRFHLMDHICLCHVDRMTACLIYVHHVLKIYGCCLLLDIFVQIILYIRNRQLKSHCLPTMTILIIKIGLCRKRNIRWLNKSIVAKKWSIN